MTMDNDKGAAEFAEFMAAGEVETPGGTPSDADDGKGGDADDGGEGDDSNVNDQGDAGEGDEGGEEGEKPQKTARDFQIERLKREKAELRRELREARRNGDVARRLDLLENRGLQDHSGDDNRKPQDIPPEPDKTDTAKYPLAHLDDAYIEDKIAWMAHKIAAEKADTVLQRQQENEQAQSARQAHQQLLGKVEDLADRGSEISDDYQELVIDTAKAGKWKLGQPTFEAAHEADHGAQILYDLSQDKKEAARVASLSPTAQVKFVLERDAEIAKGKQPRKIPKAGEPPSNPARGASSRTQGNPATDDLEDFEKQWVREGKR